MKFTFNKVDSNSFSLSWNYEGTPLVLGSLSIESITAVEGDKKWTYQSPFNIKDQSGSYSFQMI